MKTCFHAFAMCQSMFCAIPFPGNLWDEKARDKMLLFLPIVGLEMGVLWTALAWLCGVLNLPQLVRGLVLAVYPFLNSDLLLAGVIIHDLSKISEMKSDLYGNVTDYTREGLLLGHLVRGVSQVAQAAKNVGVAGEVVVLLEHMVISHHGEPDYGSPRMPMFPEAEMLHWIDLVDARMNEMQGVMRRTPAGAFSEKIWSLDRRLYHPLYEGLTVDE